MGADGNALSLADGGAPWSVLEVASLPLLPALLAGQQQDLPILPLSGERGLGNGMLQWQQY